MSYLEDIKQKVVDAIAAEIKDFKSFMDDHCVAQFKDPAANPLAQVRKQDIMDQGINVANFTKWLEDEGFKVHVSRDGYGDIVVISYA